MASSLGCAYQDTCVLGVASTTGGVPSSLGGVASTSAASTTGGVPSLLGMCIPGCMCTGGCTFIATSQKYLLT